MRFLARLLTVAALIVPQAAFALDPGKVPPITLGTGSSGDASAVNVTPSPSAAPGTLARSIADQAAALAAKAPVASPVFTGVPSMPSVALTGSGSTGDVSGMSVTAPGVPAGQPLLSWFTAPVFNGRAIVDPMGLRQGTRGDPGSRGPMFIWNNPPGTNPAGQNGGLQVWIGDNPTATPGAGDTVGLTSIISNGNGRSRIWGANIFAQVCNGSICGAGYNDAKATALELEVGNGYPTSITDPWGGGARKDGLEITAQSGSAGRIASAITTWANDNSGVGWFSNGIALSRISDYGLLFKSNPNGSTAGSTALNADATGAFGIAAIYDNSNSGNVLRIGGGNHSAVIDMTEASVGNFGYLLKAPGTADVTMTIGNAADYNMSLALSSGLNATKNADFSFVNRATPIWSFGKDANNQLRAYDVGLGSVPWRIQAGTNTVSMMNTVVSGAFVAPVGSPTSSSACTQGQMMSDSSYIYVCTAPNTWKRTAVLSSY